MTWMSALAFRPCTTQRIQAQANSARSDGSLVSCKTPYANHLRWTGIPAVD